MLNPESAHIGRTAHFTVARGLADDTLWTMPKNSECSIMELRREGGDIIARVKIGGERIVVTDYGKPQAAIVSLSDLALIEKARSPLNATGLMMAQKYLEHCESSGAKAEISEFAHTMQVKMAESKKFLVAAQTAMGKKKLI